ncbi:hypothetical protein NL493_30410, partial [Klebsiella pneumoniae]|nr:hypothetical protein [Klebsiella pneumoniae]
IDFTENYADARYSPSTYRFDEDFDPCKYSRETYIRSKNYWLQFLNVDNEKSNIEHVSPTFKDSATNNRIDRSIFGSKES